MAGEYDWQGALVWCLEHGVKAVDFNVTGYWAQGGYDGTDIMPPAALHLALDLARREALVKAREAEQAKRETSGVKPGAVILTDGPGGRPLQTPAAPDA